MAREVDELYELPPEQFTAARDALARAARATGDRDRAGEVAALRRPTVAAWLLNQLARQRADEVDQFVALGAELREATAALDAERAGHLLRDLSTQRRRLVRALVDQARGLAAQQGRRVTEDVLRSVEETLHAALADADVAQLLRAGRLTTAISRSGFAPATDGAAAGPRPAAAPAPAPRRRTRGRSGGKTLERQLAEAWAAARSAAEQRDQVVAEEEDASRTAKDAAREHDMLTSAVAQARDTAAAARAALEAAESELASAEARAAHAEELRRAADDAARAVTERRRAAEEAAERARRRVSELTEQAERQGR